MGGGRRVLSRLPPRQPPLSSGSRRRRPAPAPRAGHTLSCHARSAHCRSRMRARPAVTALVSALLCWGVRCNKTHAPQQNACAGGLSEGALAKQWQAAAGGTCCRTPVSRGLHPPRACLPLASPLPQAARAAATAAVAATGAVAVAMAAAAGGAETAGERSRAAGAGPSAARPFVPARSRAPQAPACTDTLTSVLSPCSQPPACVASPPAAGATSAARWGEWPAGWPGS